MAVIIPPSIYSSQIRRELATNGTAFPDVIGVIYNHGEKTIYKLGEDNQPIIGEDGKKVVDHKMPALATVVYSGDGSKVSVVNSDRDSVVDADGNITQAAKENGFLHAVAKRLFASKYELDEHGHIILKSEGYGRVLNEFVKNAFDQQEEAAKKAAAKEEAKKKHEELKKNAKPKNPALHDVVAQLSKAVELLTEKLSK